MDEENDPTANARAVGRWLRQLRQAAGLSQEALADAVGGDRRVILRYENEGHAPNGVMLLKILGALNVRVDPPPPDDLPKAVSEEIRSLRKAVEALVASESRGVRLGAAPRELPSPEETAAGMAELERSRKKPRRSARRSRRGDQPGANSSPGPAKP